tara:strand:+ start:1539 stop:2963 length:1425 start_codon:yes stop_codon:yes gene_type:complete
MKSNKSKIYRKLDTSKKSQTEILLVHLPFCTPASPSYSVTCLYSMLKDKCSVSVLDLNLEFHKKKFPKFGEFISGFGVGKLNEYSKVAGEYSKISSKVYAENNKKVVNGLDPEFFDEFVKMIRDSKAEIVVFSIVYSSQAFYAYSIMKELKDVVTVIGGPGVNSKLVSVADECFGSYNEFVDYLGVGPSRDSVNVGNGIVFDYSIWDLDSYFVPQFVMPVKTSNTCCYKQCVFCSHFSNAKYCEFSLESVRQSIVDLRAKNGNSAGKYVFLIDDTIPVSRLLKIGEMFGKLGVKWCCQLRPTADFSSSVLTQLKKNGLVMVIWGVESGNNRVLKLMKKGTNVNDISIILKNSHDASIKNVVYIMFGFPGETESEFMETISFLENNSININLVSTSVFGLQKGTYIYDNNKEFGISKVVEKKRTILEPKISYEISNGLSHSEVLELRKKYKKTIEKINKYPKEMNFFRESMLCFS